MKLDFDKLLGLCEGHIPVVVGQKKVNVKGAFKGGDYLGSPGKDIFFALPCLAEEEMLRLAKKHCKQYPQDPPGNHVGIAACIRYIYGQFEKQGVLRSKSDRNRMSKEELDWSLPRKFINIMREVFDERDHYYGLSITAEMEGHRLGDEAVLNKDADKLKEMEDMYVESALMAHKCGSYKQMFTSYYWAARYFILMDVTDKAVHYSKVTIKEAEKHCPDARGSYVEKLLNCAKYLRKHDKKSWNKWRNKVSAKANNTAVKKMFRKI